MEKRQKRFLSKNYVVFINKKSYNNEGLISVSSKNLMTVLYCLSWKTEFMGIIVTNHSRMRKYAALRLRPAQYLRQISSAVSIIEILRMKDSGQITG